MGAIHGLSNLGGAILAVYAASTNKSKRAIRDTVAVYYLIFGLAQLSVLIMMGHHKILATNYIAPIISIMAYVMVGNYVFLKVNDDTYRNALTAFIFLYGLLIIFNTLHRSQ